MAKSVAEICEEQGVNLPQLTELAGMSAGRIEAITAGRWTPSPKERQSIATALGVEASDITWGHKTPIQHLYGHGPG